MFTRDASSGNFHLQKCTTFSTTKAKSFITTNVGKISEWHFNITMEPWASRYHNGTLIMTIKHDGYKIQCSLSRQNTWVKTIRSLDTYLRTIAQPSHFPVASNFLPYCVIVSPLEHIGLFI